MASSEQGLRSFDLRRDLGAVADLIELGFRDELDPAGRAMLTQMRRLHRRLLSPLPFSPPYTMHGYVWIEEGAVVGNLSLRRAAPAHSGGYLIGNVVVHPDYRRRGIARALMEAAIHEVQQRRGRWIGLEVRDDNLPAIHLYEALHFHTVGKTIHYVREGGPPWPPLALQRQAWRKARPDDRPIWLQLAQTMYGNEQGKVLEVLGRAYTYGSWQRAFNLWLIGRREWAWIEAADPPRRAISIHYYRGDRYTLWEPYFHPECGAQAIIDILHLAAAITRHDQPVILLSLPHPVLEAGLRELGFHHHRTLRQMYRRSHPPHRILIGDGESSPVSLSGIPRYTPLRREGWRCAHSTRPYSIARRPAYGS